MNKALLSSNCDEWETPPDFFEKLNAEFRFTLRPLRSPGNGEVSDVLHAGRRRPFEAVDRSGGGCCFL